MRRETRQSIQDISGERTPRRMEFRDKDGALLIKWQTPEECFEAWKACSKVGLRLQRHEVEIASRCGSVRVPARIGDILPGHVFVPFRYGYWDEPGSEHSGPDGRARAANELTVTAWDVVSKQPNFKSVIE